MFGPDRQRRDDGAERLDDTEHEPDRDVGDVRVVAELLGSLVRVADVHLHQRGGELRAGVQERVGVMGPGRRVEHHRGLVVGRGVEPVEQLALVVGLAHLHVEPKVAAPRRAQVGELGVRGRPVDLGLAAAQPAEVGTVEHQDLHERSPSRSA